MDFEDGLARTVKWYRENAEWVRNVKSGEYLKYYERNYGNREGALNEDGRGHSIWDVFPKTKIADGSDASVADRRAGRREAPDALRFWPPWERPV